MRTGDGDSLTECHSKAMQGTRVAAAVSVKRPPTASHIRTADQPYASLRLDQSIVKKRVRVYWGGDDAWYCGRVSQFDAVSDQHYVVYDDGDMKRCAATAATSRST